MKNICQFGVMRVSIWLFSDLIIEKSIWKYNITLHFRLTNMLKIKDFRSDKASRLMLLLCLSWLIWICWLRAHGDPSGRSCRDYLCPFSDWYLHIWKWFSICFKMINTWLKFKLNSRTDSKCKTMFHKYSYGSDLGFPR